jgi:tellurite resistance protein TerC
VFIALGAALLELFSFMFLIFGLGLIITSIQLFRHRDRDPDVGENLVVRAARRALPLSERYDGNRLITTRDGRRLMTPMLLALIAIGTTDVLFAFDSIPAIFGISRHPYVVLVVNAFALLGLRPLYFLVSGLLDRLLYISTGLAAILAFIGVKLVLAFAHDRSHGVPEISTEISLAVIAIVLGLTTAASLLTARRDPEARAHAGALRARSADERAQPDEPSVR